jgi:hypothetical protein
MTCGRSFVVWKKEKRELAYMGVFILPEMDDKV